MSIYVSGEIYDVLSQGKIQGMLLMPNWELHNKVMLIE